MTSAVPGPSNYKGNSKVEKEVAEESATPKLKKIEGLSVIEKRPSIGSRIKENFGGQTLKSVGLHLLIDVIVPNTRDLLYDLATEGAHRSIYGDTSRRAPARSAAATSIIGSASRLRGTSYNTMSAPVSVAGRSAGDTNIVARERDLFDFSIYVMPSRDQAEEILANMIEAIEQFTTVSVGDLYDLLEVTGNGFTDQKHGWDARTFAGASVDKTRAGWILNLPAPVGLA